MEEKFVKVRTPTTLASFEIEIDYYNSINAIVFTKIINTFNTLYLKEINLSNYVGLIMRRRREFKPLEIRSIRSGSIIIDFIGNIEVLTEIYNHLSSAYTLYQELDVKVVPVVSKVKGENANPNRKVRSKRVKAYKRAREQRDYALKDFKEIIDQPDVTEAKIHLTDEDGNTQSLEIKKK